jgi:hypothetical protein
MFIAAQQPMSLTITPANVVTERRANCETPLVEEIDNGAGVLEGGQRVRVRVRSHQRYGLFVEILDHAGAVGSIDWLDIAGPDRGQARPDDFPIGAEFEAVTRRRLGPPPEASRRRYYLMIP